MDKVKTALVHDWLTGRRGGEKVLEVFAEIFPEAPIYTLIHFPGSQIPEIEKRDIRTSFLQKLPFLKSKYRFYLPFYPVAVELFDLQEYDLVISSSHCVAKGVIPKPDALHVSYIHSPMRYAWNQYYSYFSSDKLGFFSRRLVPPIIHRLRTWDAASTPRVDHFVANSRAVAQRIRRYYNRPSDVIHPPVDTDFFTPGNEGEDYFLIVSALVPYKRIDLAIETFNQNGRALKIVGSGPDYRNLKRIAKSNIRFLGALDAADLLKAYQNAAALLLPGEEDFGINALESQACGIPVIAYGRGGALETVQPNSTGLFFDELSVSSLSGSLDKFEGLAFNKNLLRANALQFSRGEFKRGIVGYFRDKWTDFSK